MDFDRWKQKRILVVDDEPGLLQLPKKKEHGIMGRSAQYTIAYLPESP